LDIQCDYYASGVILYNGTIRSLKTSKIAPAIIIILTKNLLQLRTNFFDMILTNNRNYTKLQRYTLQVGARQKVWNNCN